jgi:hypothetical protein
MEEFEKALKEFCDWQGINKPEDIKKVRESILAENSPGWNTLAYKAMNMATETSFWKGFKLGRSPIPEIEKVLGYKLQGVYHDSPAIK